MIVMIIKIQYTVYSGLDYIIFCSYLQILGSVFYLYFILVRLCIPVFMNKSSQAFSTRTLILALFHATFPGTFIQQTQSNTLV